MQIFTEDCFGGRKIVTLRSEVTFEPASFPARIVFVVKGAMIIINLSCKINAISCM